MAGGFFAEPVNVVLFVGVLGALTIMMSGCYIYHKWKHVKSRNAPDIVVPPKPKRKLKRFLRRASNSASERGRNSDFRQMRLEAGGDFNTPDTTPSDTLDRLDVSNLDDDVFSSEGPLALKNCSKPGEILEEESESGNYYSVHL